MASIEDKNIIKVSDADPFICRNINIHSQNSPMIGNRDIIPGEISPSPSTLFLPLFSTRISRTKNTQKRHQKILIQRIPNKANIPIPHQTQESPGINSLQAAIFGHPFPGIDGFHIVPLVLKTIPGVSMKWAGIIIERLRLGGVQDPISIEKVARRRSKELFSRGSGRIAVAVADLMGAGRSHDLP
ncbi:hypothetical protein COLO4_17853 [Corchorus olitorius]|uniref:Uncharacterized protein n=1 Tax=Corchorus olitorius TaxID=93759 RepID=A0A1R3JBG1_9ROSI|nr:hypothetical protein COLO4_17853 [Corchorus olitorius]